MLLTMPPNYNLYPFLLNFNTVHVLCVLINPLSFVSLFVLLVPVEAHIFTLCIPLVL
jgi:hypothetical protein